MNKGTAFGFLLIILVLILGTYVAYTGFVASREAIRALPTSPPKTATEQAFIPASTPLPTITPTLPAIITPTVIITIPVDAPAPTSEAAAPAPTEPPAQAPTEPPAAPTDTPVPPPPTPAPIPQYQFRLAGPPAGDPNYGCCYLFGTVRDANGTGLEGVQVQALNEWNTLPPALTKGGAEIGQYNIPIGRDVVTWDLMVLDAAGNQISTKVQIQYNPETASSVRINWQRTY